MSLQRSWLPYYLTVLGLILRPRLSNSLICSVFSLLGQLWIKITTPRTPKTDSSIHRHFLPSNPLYVLHLSTSPQFTGTLVRLPYSNQAFSIRGQDTLLLLTLLYSTLHHQLYILLEGPQNTPLHHPINPRSLSPRTQIGSTILPSAPTPSFHPFPSQKRNSNTTPDTAVVLSQRRLAC